MTSVYLVRRHCTQCMPCYATHLNVSLLWLVLDEHEVTTLCQPLARTACLYTVDQRVWNQTVAWRLEELKSIGTNYQFNKRWFQTRDQRLFELRTLGVWSFVYLKLSLHHKVLSSILKLNEILPNRMKKSYFQWWQNDTFTWIQQWRRLWVQIYRNVWCVYIVQITDSRPMLNTCRPS